MRPAVRLLLAALLGLTALVPSAAHAEKKTFSDTRGDVQAYTISGSEDDGYETSPSRPSRTSGGDVLRAAVSNSGDRVSVKVRYAEIQRGRILFDAFLFVVAGSNGQRHRVLIDNTFEKAGESSLRRGDRQKCSESLRHRIDYAGGTVSFSFPRTCIGSPERIRVAHLSTWVRPVSDTEGVQAYDIAFRDGGRIDRRWGFSAAVRHTR